MYRNEYINEYFMYQTTSWTPIFGYFVYEFSSDTHYNEHDIEVNFEGGT